MKWRKNSIIKKHMIGSEYMNIVKVNDSKRDVIEAIKQSNYA